MAEDAEDKTEITFHYISILSKINAIHFVAEKRSEPKYTEG